MDIEQLLDQYDVPYVTEGKNTRHGHISIHCPWCGADDPSEHLSINLTTGKWGCWRNKDHSGRSLRRLLMKLLGCSYDAAGAMLTDRSELRSIADRLKPNAHEQHHVDDSLPSGKGMQRIKLGGSLHARFRDYLYGRGYTKKHISLLDKIYGIKCALIGPFNNRIIFPVIKDKRIIGYTGRCVDGGSLRYYTLPAAAKENVLWYDRLIRGGRFLYVTEGPFDALKLDLTFRCRQLPHRATCLFGLEYTAAQVELVCRLGHQFSHVRVLFDHDALGQAMRFRRELVGVSASVAVLPDGVKDPGGLSEWQVLDLVR
jgi:hypothetical protein